MQRPYAKQRNNYNNYYDNNQAENSADNSDNWRNQNRGQRGAGRGRGRNQRGHFQQSTTRGVAHANPFEGRGGGHPSRARGTWHDNTSRKAHENVETNPTNNKIIGACLDMCPRNELILREREGLLHKFEILEEDMALKSPQPSSWPVEQGPNISQANKRTSSGPRKPLPRADTSKTIKSFARSAAGQDKTLKEDLRPHQVLKDTVKYLCTKVLTRTDSKFNVVYDFVFDRLRSVRQDLVVQRIEDENAIQILETIIRFHIYSDFRLRNEPISIYDGHINQKHLTDCLKKLLSLYQFNEHYGASRAEFEALNCLVSLGAYDVISKAVGMRKRINSKILDTAIEMALSFQCRNFVRFFRKILQLPCILQMYCQRHVAVIRNWAFQSFCIGYGVNSCKIPFSWISSLLLYPSISILHRDLGTLTVEVIRVEGNNEKYAKFQKAHKSVIASKAESISTEFYSPEIRNAINKNESYVANLCLSLSLLKV